MEFIGTGGAALSLGLSLYNTNEIMSIKSDLESLIKSDKIDIEAPKPVPPVVTSAPIPVTEASTVSETCLLYTSPSPRDGLLSRMPSSA